MAVPSPVVKPKLTPSTPGGVVMSPGGRVPPKPKAPKKTTPKKTLPVQTRAATPMQGAEDLFRTTLSQIRSLQTPLNTTAIAQPYTDASVATGQLGAGLATAVQGTGQAAQDQYAHARDEAQQHAAGFGISAGAGANPTALQDNGSSMIAQQTQAQAAAANQAAAAWQTILERAKATAVSKAQTDRQNQDTQTETQLASNIPGWAQNAEQLAFQKDTAKKNYVLALGTADDKRTNALRDYLLGVRKQGATENYQQGLLNLDSRKADQTDTAEADRVTHWSTVETRLKKAAANKKNGLSSSDVGQILSTLKGPASKSSKSQQGFKIIVQPKDASGFYGQAESIPLNHEPTAADIPAGYAQLGDTQPNYVTTGGGSQKFSWSRYKAAVGVARTLAAQRGVKLTDVQIRQLLGPTPSTKK